jgi:hypothetical protein
MFRKVLTSLAFIVLILGTAFGVILYTKGYRFNIQNKGLTTTGILSASSYPDKASIFVDGKLLSATTGSISLPPAWYSVRISKEGYQSWEKKVHIQKEILSQIDALLIPTNPSLRAITVNGVLSPVISPNGSKLAFIIPESTTSSTLKPKTGIWVLDLRNGPLGGRSEARQILEPKTSYDWQNTTLTWSSDEKQLIVSFYKKEPKAKTTTLIQALLLSADNNSTIPTEITTTIDNVLLDWNQTAKEKEAMRFASLPEPVAGLFASSSADIRFAPDETKILYLATRSATLAPIIEPPLIGSNSTDEIRKIKPGNYYIYDQKEDKNYLVADNKTIPDPRFIMWFSDSKHVITVEKNIIYSTDYDGTNKRTVYGGPFASDSVFSWPTGERLAILTNFNNPTSLPNLYELDLR